MNRAIIAAAYMDKYDRPHPLFGDGDLASVCKAPWQFSCWNEGDPNRVLIEKVTVADPSFFVATEIARDAENDELDDITNNATYYFDSRMPKYFLLALGLSLLWMTSCASTPVSSCPPPVWPDFCTTAWLIDTPHSACVSAWKDRYVRQQCLLSGEKDCVK